MQTCSKCVQLSPDTELFCLNCGADLSEFSINNIQRKKLIENPRVTAIRISVARSACPVCRLVEGVYTKDNLPTLPIEGCSGASGCDCTYAPILGEVYP